MQKEAPETQQQKSPMSHTLVNYWEVDAAPAQTAPPRERGPFILMRLVGPTILRHNPEQANRVLGSRCLRGSFPAQ